MQKGAGKLKWTTRAIEALKVNERRDFTDPDTKGLVLRVTPNGTKTWSFLYSRKSDGRKRRVQIGGFPSIGLSEARVRAGKLRSRVDDGDDPAAGVTEYKKAGTVDELLDRFLESHPRPDAAWTKECRRIFAKDVRPLIGGVKLPDLKRAHIRHVVDRVKGRGATVTVNRTLAAVRRALSWGMSKDLIDTNPALNLGTDIEETSKDRSLSVDEIRKLWNGLDDGAVGPKSALALRLVLITGQRPGEVCGARRSEIDLDQRTWLIPSARAKNRQDHVVPLSELAVQYFKDAIATVGDSEFVFPSRPRQGRESGNIVPMQSHALSHAMRNGLDGLGLAENPATPHDLRRTVATHMARLGIPDRHVSRVLNHGTEARRTITARVYIHHDYLPEKRQALETWASELTRMMTGMRSATNIIDLSARG